MANIETKSVGVTMKRLLRRKQLEQTIGLSRSTIYSKLDLNSPQYDPSFPRPIRLGSMAVAWVESDVDDWIAARIAESRGA